MGLLDNILSKTEKSTDNVGKIASDKAVEIIKNLSGKEFKNSKKIIDNLVVFTNAAGGTGASTVVSNLAYMATEKGIKTLIIDLNIMYPSQHNLFGIKQDIKKADLVSCLYGESTLGESIEYADNIHIMFANNRNIADSINCELNTAISNFTDAVEKLRQLYDLVIIDCPMRVDHTLNNTALYIADQIYIVWDDGISSIVNTEKIRRNMAMSGIEAYNKMKVVLNKRTNSHYNEYPFQKLKIELVQILPFDVNIIESGMRSSIFCKKGASKSINSNDFYSGIVKLTDTVLENGGYIE